MKQAKNNYYTKKQLKFLRDKYPKLSRRELTLAFNEKFKTAKAERSIVSTLKNHKITSGRKGYFYKGHLPWNYGTKGTGICKPNCGNFKKGHVPVNQKPLGAERICPNDGFISRKIAEPNPYTNSMSRYKHKHVYLWERANGPVPDGHVIAFRDSNKMNCKLSNLMLIKRSLLLRLNWQRYKEVPVELKPSVLALAKLKEKMFERVRGAEARRAV